MSQYVEEIGKTQRHNKAWKKVYAFLQFARPVLEVFRQANFTPECSIALGLVGLLLIQVRRVAVSSEDYTNPYPSTAAEQQIRN